jgi:hypothetical protein
MGALRLLQECPCGHAEAAGLFCSHCLSVTRPEQIRPHRKGERLPRPGCRASKELRKDPGVPEVAGAVGACPHARSGTLLEAA